MNNKPYLLLVIYVLIFIIPLGIGIKASVSKRQRPVNVNLESTLTPEQKAVLSALKDGWQVIPGTLTSGIFEAEGYSAKERYVVFLQKAKE